MTQESKKVSIIIPVYNGEKYIEECLSSAINQTYQNLEVIVVDDGSTDKTFEILNSEKEKHHEIIIKKQDNRGVSAARNQGIQISSGDYICFVDADDYIPKNYISELTKHMDKKTGLVCSEYEVFENIEDVKSEMELDAKHLDRDDTVSQILLGDRILGTPWGKLFKKDVLTSNRISFDEDIVVCEDLLFCIQYALNTSENKYTKNTKYYYRKNDSSFNANMKKEWNDIYLQRLIVCNKIGEMIEEHNLSKKVKKSFKYQYYFSYSRVYDYLRSSTEKKEELIKKARHVIRKYNYLYIWYMFKTKNFKKANFLFLIKNTFRGFGLS